MLFCLFLSIAQTGDFLSLAPSQILCFCFFYTYILNISWILVEYYTLNPSDCAEFQNQIKSYVIFLPNKVSTNLDIAVSPKFFFLYKFQGALGVPHLVMEHSIQHTYQKR